MWNGPLWSLCYGRPHLIILQVIFQCQKMLEKTVKSFNLFRWWWQHWSTRRSTNPRSASRNWGPLPYLESISLLRSFILGVPHPFTVRVSTNCIAVTHFTGKCCFTTVQFLSVSNQEEHAPGVRSLKSRTRFWFGLYSHGCKAAAQKAGAQSRSSKQRHNFTSILSRKKILKGKKQAHSTRVRRNSVQLDRNRVLNTSAKAGGPSSAFHHQHWGFRARCKKACRNLNMA